jgi:hypothetical protein
MSGTLITARLDHPIQIDQNLIYCSTVNLTWNELSALLDGMVTFTRPCQSVDFLNRRSFTKGDLDERCYLAYADFISGGILSRIPKDLKEKFDEVSRLNLDPANFQPDDILAYSFLLKVLKFEKKFEEVEGSQFYTPGIIVGEAIKTFGIKKADGGNRDVCQQVRIYQYNDPDNFIISLDTDKGDLLVLAKMQYQPGTLENGSETVDKQVRDCWRPASPRENERLVVPKLDFDLEHHFEEMIGQELLVNEKRVDYFIKDAVQFIKFSLDETGAKLRSEMAMYGVRCCSMTDFETPRFFIFDKPFLIYLKEKPNLPPYFMAWVGNTEIMKKG